MKTHIKTIGFIFALLFIAVGGVRAEEATKTLTFNSGNVAIGTCISQDGLMWIISSDGIEVPPQGDRGLHYGSNNSEVQYVKISTMGIEGVITQIEILACGNAITPKLTASATVGGKDFGKSQVIPEKTNVLQRKVLEDEVNCSLSDAIIVMVSKDESSVGAIYVKQIKITYETTKHEKVSLKKDGFSTCVTQYPIDWEKTRNQSILNSKGETTTIRGYRVIEFDKTTVVMQEYGSGSKTYLYNDEVVPSITPAGTPIILKGIEGDNELVVAEDNIPVEKDGRNLLHASDGTVTASEGKILYVMQTVNGVKGWYKLGSQSIPKGKAYLDGADEKEKVEYDSKVNNAKGFRVSLEDNDDDDITRVNTVSYLRDEGHVNCYNLSGQRVFNPSKGIYIMNGKKVVIK